MKPIRRVSVDPRSLLEELRQVCVQTIDRDFERKFVKTVHRLVVGSEGGLSVVRKRRYPEQETRGVVVLIHGFSQNRHTWHTPYRSFSNYLAFRGYDVFNLELRGFGRSGHFGTPLPTHPDDHFEIDIPKAVAAIRKIALADRVFVIGHSLGGACCYASAPLISDWIRGIVTISGVYQFAPVQGLMRAASFVGSKIVFPKRPSGFPLPTRQIGRTLGMLKPIMDSRWFRRIPLQVWYPGTVEGELIKYLTRNSFDRASLGVVIAVSWWGRLGRVTNRFGHDYLNAFDNLDRPVLFIAGSHDVLLPPSGVKPAYLNSKSSDRTFRVFDRDDGGHHWGHGDLIMGRDAPAYVWTTIADWLDER